MPAGTATLKCRSSSSSFPPPTRSSQLIVVAARQAALMQLNLLYLALRPLLIDIPVCLAFAHAPCYCHHPSYGSIEGEGKEQSEHFVLCTKRTVLSTVAFGHFRSCSLLFFERGADHLEGELFRTLWPSRAHFFSQIKIE
jgi:hypothetical protein